MNTSYNFASLHPTWWDPKGPVAMLHTLNPLRISWITQTLKNHSLSLPHIPLLDIGCGGGILSEPLARLGAHVTGIDPEPELIDIANAHAHNLDLNLSYHTDTAENYALHHPHTFDVITCMEVLEHHPSPPLLLKACKKLLKPNGILLLSTLNRTPASRILAVKLAENILRLLPKNTHDPSLFLHPHELSRLLRQHQFSPLNASGLTYNPLLNSWQLNPHNLSINYFFAAQSAK